MPLPHLLRGRLRLPIVAAPMFLVSSPELVIAQCRAGIVGTMPSLNVRAAEDLDGVLAGIADALDDRDAPFGVNLISHATNPRLDHDLDVCVRRRVPVVITSLGPSERIVSRVREYGGIVLHDVIGLRHARKAVAAGVDGLIAVAAGAGGHAGTASPFALCAELRSIWGGPLALAGAIGTGSDLLAARCMGADLAYMGTRFIATRESAAPDAYKAMLVASGIEDVIYTPYFSGVRGNYLRASIEAGALDIRAVADAHARPPVVTGDGIKKAWKDIWSAGHGVGAIGDVPTVAALVDRLEAEFERARSSLGREPLRHMVSVGP
jgi:nitronate monooxygenase